MVLQSIPRPWYQPKLNRRTVHTAFRNIPHSKLVKGAFIVREGNANTQYCLSVLVEPENFTHENAFKHILISMTKDKKFYICLRPDEKDFLFDSVMSLINFYQTTSIGIHYHDTNCVLTDLFEARLDFDSSNIHEMKQVKNNQVNSSRGGGDFNNNPTTSTTTSSTVIEKNKKISAPKNQNQIQNNDNNNVPFLNLPKTLKRSRGRSAYNVHGAVKAINDYKARNEAQEANLINGDFYVMVGNKSGPWLPVVPYNVIKNLSKGDMRDGLDLQKRYAPSAYCEDIEFELYAI